SSCSTRASSLLDVHSTAVRPATSLQSDRQSLPGTLAFLTSGNFSDAEPTNETGEFESSNWLLDLQKKDVVVRESRRCMLNKYYLVRKRGVEPLRVLPHRILNPARLPIPPLSRRS